MSTVGNVYELKYKVSIPSTNTPFSNSTGMFPYILCLLLCWYHVKEFIESIEDSSSGHLVYRLKPLLLIKT